MGYSINPIEYSSAFTIPSSIVEKHIKLSGATQLKVLLIALKNIASSIDVKSISNTLNISEPDVIDALNYWVDMGVLLNDTKPDIPKQNTKIEPKKAVRAQLIKPSREEVIRRGAEDERIAFLLREAQFKFARPLRANESSTLVWLHDDEGLDVSVILILIAFAVNEGKATIGFIEKTAVNWINNGVNNVEDAEKEINRYFENKNAWNSIRKITGIDKRKPTEKEEKLIHKWYYDFKYDEKIIKKAYEKCVDSTTKFSFPYMDKIITSWYESGVKSIEDVDSLALKNNSKIKEKIDTYDLELYKNSLDILPK